MKLERISPLDIDAYTVDYISNGIVYYVHSGRNAWHSTWVGQYTRGCMHTTLDSAKQHAEKLRTSGTVFYITQLPCLILHSDNIMIVITEINSENPLSGYSLKKHVIGYELDQITTLQELDFYLFVGAPLSGVATSFLPTSKFWKYRPSPKCSTMILTADDSTVVFEISSSDLLLTFESFSSGGNNFLGWREKSSRIKSTAIELLMKSVNQ